MTNILPILYSFRRCPYAMRARMAISLAAQTVELREIVLKAKPDSLHAYSEKATVPVLILTDGKVLDESLDIMLWALSMNDSDNLLKDISCQESLIQENDTRFKTNLDKYKYADRYPEHSELFYRKACYAFLDKLEERLQTHQYLFSDQYSLADLAIFPFIRQFAHVDLTWFEHSQWLETKHWLNEFKSSDLFKNIMTKYPQWKEGATPTYFPAI